MPPPSRRVLVATTREVEQHGPSRQRGPFPGHPRQGVGRLKCRDDALRAAQELEGLHHLGIGDRLVAGPSGGSQMTVFGPDARIVQSGADRLRLQDLAELVLHQVGLHAVDHAGGAPTNSSPAGGFHPDQFGRRIGEAGEDPDGVGTASHAGHYHVRRPPQQGLALLPGLEAEHLLEGTHHPGVGVRPHHRTEAVVRVLDGGHPVSHGLVHRILQGPAPGHRRPDLRTQQLHAEHIEFLTTDVHLTHVDAALHAQEGGGRGRSHSVLAGPCLGQESGLAHPPGQQGLSQHVVDLVGTRVVEVLALQEQTTTQFLGEVVAFGHWRRPAGVVGEQPVQLSPV